MSNEIQAISQGNYILQGTVATSAGIVGDGSTQNPLRVDSEYIKLLSVNQPLTAVVQNYVATASVPDGYEFLCWVNMCTNDFSQIYYPLSPTTCTWWLGGSMTYPGAGDTVDSRYLVIKKA